MEIYKINSTDSKVTALAKKIAIICEFAVHNPLHVAFEDGNFRVYDNIANNMEYEFLWNEEYRKNNGEKMYNYIKNFLEEFIELSAKEQMECYHLSKKKWKYLGNKVWKKIESMNKGLRCFKHYLGDDGTIYMTTIDGRVAWEF